MDRIYQYIINVILIAALVACVPIGHTANAVDRCESESFCLRHTGPQDKSLPTICFVQNEMVNLNNENYVIEVRISDVKAIKKLAKNFDEPSCRGEYGSYASNGHPQVVICKENMKIFLREVKKRLADASVINSIDQLLLRL